MTKKPFSVLLTIFILISIFSGNINASALSKTPDFSLTAKSGILISMDTGEILFKKNIDQKIYPASLTKIMTAVVILESEKYNPKAYITMTQNAVDKVSGTGSKVSDLKSGEKITQKDLIYLIVMSSDGDCAYLAAEYFGGSVENFVELMNQKAQKLGLNGTKYTNPIGLHHTNNYTTVRDLQKLTEYALKNETFKEICQTAHYEIAPTNMSGARTISSTNLLQLEESTLYRPYIKGVKTGFTNEAGRCLVSTASYNGYNYMCIVMGCPAYNVNHFTESTELYDWAFNNFSFKELSNPSVSAAKIAVELSDNTDCIDLNYKESFRLLLPNDVDDSAITIKKNLNSETVEAPVKKGDVLGTAEIIYNGQIVKNVELVAAMDVEPSRFFIFKSKVKKFFLSPFMKFVYIVIALVITTFLAYCVKLNINLIKKSLHKHFRR